MHIFAEKQPLAASYCRTARQRKYHVPNVIIYNGTNTIKNNKHSFCIYNCKRITYTHRCINSDKCDSNSYRNNVGVAVPISSELQGENISQVPIS